MTDPRYFSASQRLQLFMKAEGKCQACRKTITLDDFHADHITPFSRGGKTILRNGQALCVSCNLTKSSKMDLNYSNHLPPGRKPRKWQMEFIERAFESVIGQINKPPSEIQTFMLHAFPGSGKTFASTLVARLLLEHGFIERVIICVPSKLLRNQMADDAREVGLFLNKKNLDDTGDFQGIVTTYAQIGNVDRSSGNFLNAERLRQLCAEKKTMVIADECHHLSAQKNWGDSFELAFSQSVARLMTSGTPFRSDKQRLPWVRYQQKKIDLSPPHGYSYGYGLSEWNKNYCALGDQVVRDVVIHPWDGEVNFTIKNYKDNVLVNEREFSHRLTDDIEALYPCEVDEETGERVIDNRRLREQIKSNRRKACIECGTERHPHGTDYIRDQLVAANDMLKDCRRAHSWAGGLIVCDGIEHANSVAEALKHWTGEEAVVVHSESGNDVQAIKDFREDRTPARTKWIISVGKISEGVDIKHLRVGVYLSSIQAPLRWTQILGRILRTEKDLDWDMQTAHFFQYDDGIESVEDDEGNTSPSSVNIKFYAESLMEERWTTLEIKSPKKDPREGEGWDSPNGNFTNVESISATGINTQQIYEGERINNSELEPYKILAVRLGMPAVKVAALVAKGGPAEWRKAVDDKW